MLNERIFTLITRLITSRWVRQYAEHHSPYEDSAMACLGPFQLSTNDCFVLDHHDASVSLHLPLPGGYLRLSYTVCQGAEQIRQPGWSAWRQQSYRSTLPTAPTEEFPF